MSGRIDVTEARPHSGVAGQAPAERRRPGLWLARRGGYLSNRRLLLYSSNSCSGSE